MSTMNRSSAVVVLGGYGGTGAALALDACGDGEAPVLRIVVHGADPYEGTAAPVVSAIRQLASGGGPTPGLYLMGAILDPEATLVDLRACGVAVDVEEVAA